MWHMYAAYDTYLDGDGVHCSVRIRVAVAPPLRTSRDYSRFAFGNVGEIRRNGICKRVREGSIIPVPVSVWPRPILASLLLAWKNLYSTKNLRLFGSRPTEQNCKKKKSSPTPWTPTCLCTTCCCCSIGVLFTSSFLFVSTIRCTHPQY